MLFMFKLKGILIDKIIQIIFLILIQPNFRINSSWGFLIINEIFIFRR